MMEFLQELAKPTRLGYVVCNNAIFSLRTRAGDRRLSPGRPGDQIVTNDAFDELKMGCARVMHEQTYLFYRVGEVWASEGEVLKGDTLQTYL
jgi:hypothetical protein